MQPLGLERWARPAGGLSGLGAGASCTEAAPPRRTMAGVPRQKHPSGPRWVMAQRDNAI
jgi:hypothetical protein